MKEDKHSYLNIAAAAFLLYLLPTLLVALFGLLLLTEKANWLLFSLNLLAASGGTIALFTLLLRWRSPREAIVEQPAAEESQAERELLASLDERDYSIEKLLEQQERYKRKCEKGAQELLFYQEKSEEALEAEKLTIQEQEQTIDSLRYQAEEKQIENEALQNKIHDLTYEIKTLLQLADMDHSISSSGHTLKESAEEYLVDLSHTLEEEELIAAAHAPHHYAEEAESQLKRCINIAQKVTSSHNFGSYNSRFRDLSLDNDALDLRRLCDNLQGESGNMVLVYSQKNRKVLFVNNEVKSLLGWNPEKFMLDFESIIQKGMEEWRHALTELNSHNRARSSLMMKMRSGQELLVHCEMGLIPTGIFRHNVIVIIHTPTA